MKSKFQKKKDRENKVKRKILIRRQALRTKAKEIRKFEDEARQLEKAEKKPSVQLQGLLERLEEIPENI